MKDLFELPTSLSPRAKWFAKYAVKIVYQGGPVKDDFCDLDRFVAIGYKEGSLLPVECDAPTEDEAIAGLAKKLGVRLWNEEGQ